MPSTAAITIYAFGFTSFIFGTLSLLYPQNALETLNLPSAAQPAANGNALAALAMGLYYTLAAYQENRTFFVMTVPMRLLTATVFNAQGGPWRMPAAWECCGALSTAAMLLWGG